MLALVQTLFDIALLRKGPEHIPRSSMLLVVVIVFWVFAVLCQVVLIPRIDESDFIYEVFSALVGVTCYSAVIIGFGHGPRLTQTITALLGCGALLAIIFALVFVILQAIGSQLMALLAVWGIVLWSVSIKGHIISRAIDRHWYLGLAIAVSVFILQHVVHAYVSGG
ncbi:MAG: hypothetical protein ACR2QS_04925 [Woeseiaceae bacterium]